MTKQEIFDAFNDLISKKSIVQRDDEWVIQGKWCIIANEGDLWDIWLCNPKDMVNGLGARKLTNLVSHLNSLVEWPFRELNGEAYTKVAGTALISASLRLLGIKKKRNLSQEQIDKFVQRTKEYRLGAMK